MLEDDGFVLVGSVTFRAPSSFLVHFDRSEALSWGPAIYAYRIGNEVLRIGKTESTLKHHMVMSQRLISRALEGKFYKHGPNPWEAFEWRRRLTEHRYGEFLARLGPTAEKRALINRYDPPLCNDGPCSRSRPREARSVEDVTAATAYWRRLNSPSA
jgi:hypothetical protein